MDRLLRELDHADMRRRHPWGSRLRRTVGRREGLLALFITGGTIAGVVLIGPVWADEVPSPYDGPTASADEPSTVDELTSALAPPKEALSPVRILPPVIATTTGAHKLFTAPGGQLMAYDPCRPIHYVVNPAGAPADGEDLIREAVSEISAATGLAFVYDGVTDERPSLNRDPYPDAGAKEEWAPVLVSWSDDEEIPELEGDTAGYGGSISVDMDKTRSRYISGYVILDGEDFTDILYEYYDRAGAKAIVLHEFGHLVGLDHVEDSDEVMAESATSPTFGPGDRQGLAILGSGPCFPNP